MCGIYYISFQRKSSIVKDVEITHGYWAHIIDLNEAIKVQTETDKEEGVILLCKRQEYLGFHPIGNRFSCEHSKICIKNNMHIYHQRGISIKLTCYKRLWMIM
jgi:hypothetical protein